MMFLIGQGLAIFMYRPVFKRTDLASVLDSSPPAANAHLFCDGMNRKTRGAGTSIQFLCIKLVSIPVPVSTKR